MNHLLRSLKSGFSWSAARTPKRPPPTTHAARTKPAGLGDAVKALTSAVGIEPCGGCQKRAEWLNRKVPFRRPREP